MPVVDFEITQREPYAGGQAFGVFGPFEQVDGVLTFAVDPEHEANRSIVDLALAPRDDQGRVRFRADFSLIQPAEAGRGNRRLLVELPNRGRRRVVYVFNRVPASAQPARQPPPGDGFLFRHGYSVASIGWQWDVFGSDALMGLEPPYAEVDGEPIRGQTVVEIRPNDHRTTYLLANRIHKPLPTVDLDDPDAVLRVRDYEDGEDTVVPRSAWRFARENGGGVEASSEYVYMEGGFEPGKIYCLVYTTEGAPVAGAGLLAVRDVAGFLRRPSEMNPGPGEYDAVYAWGVSQTGRMLRHLLYLGLNVSEDGQMAYDGILPHVAGARRGAFNHRFAQPSDQSTPNWGHWFPFADEPSADLLTGRRGGLLDRLRERGAVPKVIYTNSSAEYWRGDGNLAHIDTGATTDLPEAPESRSYHFSGTQHGAGYLGQSRTNANDGGRARYDLNVVDYSPLLRASLINMDRWVTGGVEPPPSRHPRLADGTAAERRDVLAVFEQIPGVEPPDVQRLFYLRTVDLGSGEAGGVGRYPGVEGATYPSLVSAVDGDGNERAGVRLPDVSVPVGTHTGWNPRAPETGAPEQVVSMNGLTSFFPVTREQRAATGDPRPSLEERYGGRAGYLARVRDATEELVEQRYVLEEDADLVAGNAAARYDVAMAPAEAVAQPASG